MSTLLLFIWTTGIAARAAWGAYVVVHHGRPFPASAFYELIGRAVLWPVSMWHIER
jgi:hypothetical protein